ncbi:protein l-myc-1-like [Lynx pardinus]|uniref:Myc proto-oncogene protein n=1 Tax=Lynx pardinus TaxID=191816 RepID=A0A485MPY4_LYNPA|nr:protein l-myc-1-like [Lynx pardinus]
MHFRSNIFKTEGVIFPAFSPNPYVNSHFVYAPNTVNYLHFSLPSASMPIMELKLRKVKFHAPKSGIFLPRLSEVPAWNTAVKKSANGPGWARRATLVCAPKTQACSGSESPSDSEGEEIDVVTVEKRQSLGVRKPVTITVRADPLDPCMKHFHISIHQQQHNYAARFPPESCSQGGAPERGPQEEALEKDAPEEKEEEVDEEIVSPPPVESEAPQSCHPKPVSSDTEDVTKRKNHNFLERKRRNDLRSRFLALRDQVPTLASCSKAPKVVILSKALEYLQALVGAEKRMATEKRQLRCRQQQLQKRIAYLSGY